MWRVVVYTSLVCVAVAQVDQARKNVQAALGLKNIPALPPTHNTAQAQVGGFHLQLPDLKNLKLPPNLDVPTLSPLLPPNLRLPVLAPKLPPSIQPYIPILTNVPEINKVWDKWSNKTITMPQIVDKLKHTRFPDISPNFAPLLPPEANEWLKNHDLENTTAILGPYLPPTIAPYLNADVETLTPFYNATPQQIEEALVPLLPPGSIVPLFPPTVVAYFNKTNPMYRPYFDPKHWPSVLEEFANITSPSQIPPKVMPLLPPATLAPLLPPKDVPLFSQKGPLGPFFDVRDWPTAAPWFNLTSPDQLPPEVMQLLPPATIAPMLPPKYGPVVKYAPYLDNLPAVVPLFNDTDPKHEIPILAPLLAPNTLVPILPPNVRSSPFAPLFEKDIPALTPLFNATGDWKQDLKNLLPLVSPKMLAPLLPKNFTANNPWAAVVENLPATVPEFNLSNPAAAPALIPLVSPTAWQTLSAPYQKLMSELKKEVTPFVENPPAIAPMWNFSNPSAISTDLDKIPPEVFVPLLPPKLSHQPTIAPYWSNLPSLVPLVDTKESPQAYLKALLPTLSPTLIHNLTGPLTPTWSQYIQEARPLYTPYIENWPATAPLFNSSNGMKKDGSNFFPPKIYAPFLPKNFTKNSPFAPLVENWPQAQPYFNVSNPAAWPSLVPLVSPSLWKNVSVPYQKFLNELKKDVTPYLENMPATEPLFNFSQSPRTVIPADIGAIPPSLIAPLLPPKYSHDPVIAPYLSNLPSLVPLVTDINPPALYAKKVLPMLPPRFILNVTGPLTPTWSQYIQEARPLYTPYIENWPATAPLFNSSNGMKKDGSNFFPPKIYAPFLPKNFTKNSPFAPLVENWPQAQPYFNVSNPAAWPSLVPLVSPSLWKNVSVPYQKMLDRIHNTVVPYLENWPQTVRDFNLSNPSSIAQQFPDIAPSVLPPSQLAPLFPPEVRPYFNDSWAPTIPAIADWPSVQQNFENITKDVKDPPAYVPILAPYFPPNIQPSVLQYVPNDVPLFVNFTWPALARTMKDLGSPAGLSPTAEKFLPPDVIQKIDNYSHNWNVPQILAPYLPPNAVPFINNTDFTNMYPYFNVSTPIDFVPGLVPLFPPNVSRILNYTVPYLNSPFMNVTAWEHGGYRDFFNVSDPNHFFNVPAIVNATPPQFQPYVRETIPIYNADQAFFKNVSYEKLAPFINFTNPNYADQIAPMFGPKLAPEVHKYIPIIQNVSNHEPPMLKYFYDFPALARSAPLFNVPAINLTTPKQIDDYVRGMIPLQGPLAAPYAEAWYNVQPTISNWPSVWPTYEANLHNLSQPAARERIAEMAVPLFPPIANVTVPDVMAFNMSTKTEIIKGIIKVLPPKLQNITNQYAPWYYKYAGKDWNSLVPEWSPLLPPAIAPMINNSDWDSIIPDIARSRNATEALNKAIPALAPVLPPKVAPWFKMTPSVYDGWRPFVVPKLAGTVFAPILEEKTWPAVWRDMKKLENLQQSVPELAPFFLPALPPNWRPGEPVIADCSQCGHGFCWYDEVERKNVCDCEEGFSGFYCNVTVSGDVCSVFNCAQEDDGKCYKNHDDRSDPYCVCPPHRSGDHCEIVDACHSTLNYCNGHGTCHILNSDTASCFCYSEWAGERCEKKKAAVCDTNPCQNGGKCVPDYGSPVCHCPEGFYGPNCETKGTQILKCDIKEVTRCVLAQSRPSNIATDPQAKCSLYESFIACAEQGGCPSMIKVWCSTNIKRIPGCLSSGKVQECIATQDKGCNTDIYYQCYTAIERASNNAHYCDYLKDYVQCAIDAQCDDLTATLCSAQECNKPYNCPIVKTGSGSQTSLTHRDLIEAHQALGWAAPPYHPHWHKPDPIDTPVILLSVLIASLVVLLVGAAIYYRIRESGSEEGSYEELQGDELI